MSSSKNKVQPSPRTGSTSKKYEVRTDEDDANVPSAADSGGGSNAGKPPRRHSFSIPKDPQDSPSVAKMRRRSMGGEAQPSPRLKGTSGGAGTPRDSSGEGPGFMSTASPRVVANRKSSIAPSPSGNATGRRESFGGLASRSASFKKKNVTFRNPLSDIRHADNTITQSQVESADYSLGGDEGSGVYDKAAYNKRRRRRQPQNLCCVVS